MTDNAAALQLRVEKATNVFLSTLAAPGESQFLTVLKPCSILLPHVHPRANEFYSVIFGAPPCNMISLSFCVTACSRGCLFLCPLPK